MLGIICISDEIRCKSAEGREILSLCGIWSGLGTGMSIAFLIEFFTNAYFSLYLHALNYFPLEYNWPYFKSLCKNMSLTTVYLSLAFLLNPYMHESEITIIV